MKLKIFLIFLMGVLFIPNFVLAVNQNTHSIDFESSSSQYAFITDANQTGLDLSSTFTLEGWIKFESFNNIWNWFIFKADSSLSADQRSYFFGYEHSDKSLRLGIYNGTKNNQSQVSWQPKLDTWYHVAVTFNNNQVKFFVNGSQQGTTQTNTYSSANNGSADFNFGTDKRTDEPSYTDGKFDDWKVWNDVRTASEIADNYKKELVGDEAGLVGYWKFNNNPNDTTSNDNDLTIANSPSYSSDYAFEYDPNPDPDPTPTTTPTIATEDAHIMNTILLILAFILGADLLRRIFTPLDKRRGL